MDFLGNVLKLFFHSESFSNFWHHFMTHQEMKQLWPLAPAASFLFSGKIAEMNKCFVSHGSFSFLFLFHFFFFT